MFIEFLCVIRNGNVHFDHSVVYIYFYIPEDKTALNERTKHVNNTSYTSQKVLGTFSLGGVSTYICRLLSGSCRSVILNSN